MNTKSTIEDIRRRFDGDVERFSNLQTGQSATIDAPLVLELVTEAAAATTPHARAVLDVGCGAGNYTLKLLQRLPDLDVTLLDLSRPMLDRAVQRVSAATRGKVVALQGDVREADLPEGGFDVILAAAEVTSSSTSGASIVADWPVSMLEKRSTSLSNRRRISSGVDFIPATIPRSALASRAAV